MFVFVMSRTRSASDGYLQTVRPVVRLFQYVSKMTPSKSETGAVVE